MSTPSRSELSLPSDRSASGGFSAAYARWLERAGECQTIHFAVVVEYVLFAACATMGLWAFTVQPGERQAPSSLLSYFPPGFLSSHVPFYVFRAMLWVGMGLWIAGLLMPWCCWITTIGAIGLWSMHLENTTDGAHVFHAAAMMLIVQSIWRTSLASEIAAAKREGTLWSTPLYPRWAFWLGLFYMGWFHTLAGLAKLYESGFAWANGTSLQLWVHWDAYPWSPARDIICRYHGLAVFLQCLTLVFETSGILGLSKRLRPWIGLGLLGFYVGVLTTFPYGFQYNAALTALFFLPFDRWIGEWVAKRQQRAAIRQRVQSPVSSQVPSPTT
jgi:hypothetical protein